jgi:hypothetical protein
MKEHCPVSESQLNREVRAQISAARKREVRRCSGNKTRVASLCALGSADPCASCTSFRVTFLRAATEVQFSPRTPSAPLSFARGAR